MRLYVALLVGLLLTGVPSGPATSQAFIPTGDGSPDIPDTKPMGNPIKPLVFDPDSEKTKIIPAQAVESQVEKQRLPNNTLQKQSTPIERIGKPKPNAQTKKTQKTKHLTGQKLPPLENIPTSPKTNKPKVGSNEPLTLQLPFVPYQGTQGRRGEYRRAVPTRQGYFIDPSRAAYPVTSDPYRSTYSPTYSRNPMCFAPYRSPYNQVQYGYPSRSQQTYSTNDYYQYQTAPRMRVGTYSRRTLQRYGLPPDPVDVGIGGYAQTPRVRVVGPNYPQHSRPVVRPVISSR
ncbi:MAG: hypothetical protein ACFCD0_11720 [Gemmataceae bacterium]